MLTALYRTSGSNRPKRPKATAKNRKKRSKFEPSPEVMAEEAWGILDDLRSSGALFLPTELKTINAKLNLCLADGEYRPHVVNALIENNVRLAVYLANRFSDKRNDSEAEKFKWQSVAIEALVRTIGSLASRRTAARNIQSYLVSSINRAFTESIDSTTFGASHSQQKRERAKLHEDIGFDNLNETIGRLCARLHAGDWAAKELLVEACSPIVSMAIDKYTKPQSDIRSRDDLQRIAELSLCDAVNELAMPHNWSPRNIAKNRKSCAITQRAKRVAAELYNRIQKAIRKQFNSPTEMEIESCMASDPSFELNSCRAPDDTQLPDIKDDISSCCKTGFERQVVELSAKGMNDSEIARRLGVERGKVVRARKSVENRYDDPGTKREREPNIFDNAAVAIGDALREVDDEIQARFVAFATPGVSNYKSRSERVSDLYDQLRSGITGAFGALLCELMPEASQAARTLIARNHALAPHYNSLVARSYTTLTKLLDSFKEPHNRKRNVRDFVATALIRRLRNPADPETFDSFRVRRRFDTPTPISGPRFARARLSIAVSARGDEECPQADRASVLPFALTLQP